MKTSAGDDILPELAGQDYAVVATLGPSSADAPDWNKMLAAGATAFRLNSSHLSIPELLDWMERLESFFETSGRTVEVVIDLQGSKWRLGSLAPRLLELGAPVTLALAGMHDEPGSAQDDILPVPHPDFFRAAQDSDGEVVLNDAKVRLRIERIRADRIDTRVVQAGPISARKGLALPGSNFRSETLSEKDHAIVARTLPWAFASYAISYVKDAAEMQGYCQIFEHLTGKRRKLIAKLERASAMRDAQPIADCVKPFAGALWICRGDLGAEMGLTGMARAVRTLTHNLRGISAPVIMAGQVLEHLTCAPDPTRSEVCYLHDCLSLGCRGFVLSDETATGPYPVESCRAAAMFRHADQQAPNLQ